VRVCRVRRWTPSSFERRRQWDAQVTEFLRRRREGGRAVVYVGDLNVAPEVGVRRTEANLYIHTKRITPSSLSVLPRIDSRKTVRVCVSVCVCVWHSGITIGF
jgi:hypothetical protein